MDQNNKTAVNPPSPQSKQAMPPSTSFIASKTTSSFRRKKKAKKSGSMIAGSKLKLKRNKTKSGGNSFFMRKRRGSKGLASGSSIGRNASAAASEDDNNEDNVSDEGSVGGGAESDLSIKEIIARRKRKKKTCSNWIEQLKKAWIYFKTVASIMMAHPTWRMRKRQACVLASCLCQMGNLIPIFMSYGSKHSVYAQIYSLNQGEVAVEVIMYLLDLTLLFTGYSGTAWWAIPWLSLAPLYWIYELYKLSLYFFTPPATGPQKYRMYDHIVRAVLYPYLYLVIYSAFGYLLTFVKMGFEYDPKDEHVPVITPGNIVQMEEIAQRQGMTAPEALLYIYKKTGQNWGVTSTALQFDPNASLPKYRGK